MAIVEPSLIRSIDQVHLRVIARMNESSANLVTVDKSKMKTLMDQVRKLETETLNWATQ